MILFGALSSALAATPVIGWDFDTTDGGFVASGSPNLWEWGAPTADPHACADKGGCWCTHLAGDYAANTHDLLTFPDVPLDGLVMPRLKMAHTFDIDAGDSGTVEVDRGSGWEAAGAIYGGGVTSFTGATGDWRTVYFDLTGVTNGNQIRLVLDSDDTINRPGWCVDQVELWDGDVAPPFLQSVVEPVDTQDVEGPYVITMDVVDDVEVASVLVHWSDGVTDSTESMTHIGGSTWSVGLPAQPPDTTVSWWLEASDSTDNVITYPQGGTSSFRVYLAAPTGLEVPSGRLVGNTAPLAWVEPESPHAVDGYRIYRDGGLLDLQAEAAYIDVPLDEMKHTFAVTAVYATALGLLEGDVSEPVVVETSLPAVAPFEPDEGWPSEELRIDVLATYLQFVQGDVALDLGDGIDVVEATVTDVNRATFRIRIAEDAVAGPRLAKLTSGDFLVQVGDAFEVLDGDDRPALVSITPDALDQSAHDQVEIVLTQAPAAVPEVDLGEGVVVEAVEVVGTRILVEVTVAPDAPLGERDVIVDDGRRIMGGIPFRVRDQTVPAEKNCATGRPPGISGLLAAVALLIVRRRRSGVARIL